MQKLVSITQIIYLVCIIMVGCCLYGGEGELGLEIKKLPRDLMGVLACHVGTVGKCVAQFKGPFLLKALSFDETEEYLVSLSEDQTVRRWNVATHYCDVVSADQKRSTHEKNGSWNRATITFLAAKKNHNPEFIKVGSFFVDESPSVDVIIDEVTSCILDNVASYYFVCSRKKKLVALTNKKSIWLIKYFVPAHELFQFQL